MLENSDAPDKSLRDAKAALRKEVLARRKAAFTRHGFLAGRSVAIIGLDFASVPYGATIAVYAPMKDEFDPLALTLKLEAEGFPLALPVIQGKGLPLAMRAWKPGDPTKAGTWGIKEPLDTAPEVTPRCLLVPLVAFDAQGYRLGYGGGFYDRTLAKLRAANPKTIAIGIAFDEQRVDAVPHAGYDQRLDWVLTPSGAKRCKPAEPSPV